MAVFIEALVLSLKNIQKNRQLLPLIVLFDLIFLLFFGASTYFLQSRLGAPITALVEAAGKLGSEISLAVAQGTSALSVLLGDPVVATNLRVILSAVLMFIIALYVTWIILGGASWRLAYLMNDGKTRFLQFFNKFSIVSAVWFAIFSVAFAILARVILYALLRPEQILSSVIFQQIGMALRWILFYFMLISLSLVPYTQLKENLKKTFVYGAKELPNFLIAFLIIGVALYLNFKITFVLLQPFTGTIKAAYVIAFIRFLLAAPFVVWARMYLMLVAKKAARV
jgi:hypothetical protein